MTGLNDKSEKRNLLPYDGVVQYFGPVISENKADEYNAALSKEVAWEHDTIVMFGKRIVTKRKVAWYGDEGFTYAYSGSRKTALPWTPHLRILKALVEEVSGETFNSCLLNYYHNGNEGMSWHSDDEAEMAPGRAIASMSLGAQRRFSFRHKSTKETVSLQLEHGSLLVMAGETQKHWHHQLPKSARIIGSRINLTFRVFRSATTI